MSGFTLPRTPGRPLFALSPLTTALGSADARGRLCEGFAFGDLTLWPLQDRGVGLRLGVLQKLENGQQS